MVKVIIRCAKYSDLKQMKALNEKCLQENYDMDYWVDMYNKNKTNSFVAVFSNIVIGYLFGTKDTVISLAVDEKYRRYGIARMLLQYHINSTDQNIILHVRVDNDSARRLYKSLNFIDEKIIKDYYHNPICDCYEMIHKYDGIKYPEKVKINIQNQNQNQNQKDSLNSN